MREMYQNSADDVSPSSPNPSLNGNSNGDSISDPFYDRFPWFRLIGRSYVYLSNMIYPVSLLHEKVPIVNEHGDVKGYLKLIVQASTSDDTDTVLNSQLVVKQSARINFDNDEEQEANSQENVRTILEHLKKKDNKELMGLRDDNLYHLQRGKDFSFRVIIVNAVGVEQDFSDVFVQFR